MAILTDDESGLPSAEAFSWGPNLEAAFAAFKRCWPVLFVGGCIKSCTQGGGGNMNSLGDLGDLANNPDIGQEAQLMLAGIGVFVILLALFFGVLFFLVRVWLTPGWLRVHEEILRTGKSDWSTLFSGGDRFLPMAGWTLLSRGILTLTTLLVAAPGAALAFYGGYENQVALLAVGFIVAVVPALCAAIWIGLGQTFGDYLITFDERGVFETLGESWTLASGTRWSQSVLYGMFFFVAIAAVFVGLLMCCVGIYVTLPIMIAINEFATTRAVLLYLRPRSETSAWVDLNAPG